MPIFPSFPKFDGPGGTVNEPVGKDVGKVYEAFRERVQESLVLSEGGIYADVFPFEEPGTDRPGYHRQQHPVFRGILEVFGDAAFLA
ncbi:MAG: hypothetical protein LBR80_05900 [Deltaproteobacteria bacterium]|jgi:hypothetical protein|nr:hypothetical protein [Deltaproteobacteria bacterium]